MKIFFLTLINFQMLFTNPSMVARAAEDPPAATEVEVESSNEVATLNITYGMIWMVGSIVTIYGIGQYCPDLSFKIFDHTMSLLTTAELIVMLSFFINDMVIRSELKDISGSEDEKQGKSFKVNARLYQSQGNSLKSLAGIYFSFMAPFLVAAMVSLYEAFRGSLTICPPLRENTVINELGKRQLGALISKIAGTALRTLGLGLKESQMKETNRAGEGLVISGALIATMGSPLVTKMIKKISQWWMKKSGMNQTSPKYRILRDRTAHYISHPITRAVVASLMATLLGVMGGYFLENAGNSQKKADELMEKANRLEGKVWLDRLDFDLGLGDVFAQESLSVNDSDDEKVNVQDIKGKIQRLDKYCMDQNSRTPDFSCQCASTHTCYSFTPLLQHKYFSTPHISDFSQSFALLLEGKKSYQEVDLKLAKETASNLKKKWEEMVNRYNKEIRVKNPSYPLVDSSLTKKIRDELMGGVDIEEKDHHFDIPTYLENHHQEQVEEGVNVENGEVVKKLDSPSRPMEVESKGNEVQKGIYQLPEQGEVEENSKLTLWQLITRKYWNVYQEEIEDDVVSEDLNSSKGSPSP